MGKNCAGAEASALESGARERSRKAWAGGGSMRQSSNGMRQSVEGGRWAAERTAASLREAGGSLLGGQADRRAIWGRSGSWQVLLRGWSLTVPGVELWWCSKGSADDEVGWKAVAGQTREVLCWATPSFATTMR